MAKLQFLLLLPYEWGGEGVRALRALMSKKKIPKVPCGRARAPTAPSTSRQ
jgi:hypothetical protein